MAHTADAAHHHTAAPPQPMLSALVVSQLADRHAVLLRELAHGLGSPLQVVLPQVFEATAKAFLHTLDVAGITGRLRYVQETNPTRCFAQRCAALGICIDAKSVPALMRALDAGVPGRDIGASGSDKSSELLMLALLHGSLVTIGSLQELQRVIDLARHCGRRARLLLHVSSEAPSSAPRSFGLHAAEVPRALEACGRERAHLQVEGLSLSWHGHEATALAGVAGRMVDLCLQARAQGQPCSMVHISSAAIVPQAETPSSPLPPFGIKMLTHTLAAPAGDHRTLAQRLQQHGLHLLLEPGDALLEQAGFTLTCTQGQLTHMQLLAHTGSADMEIHAPAPHARQLARKVVATLDGERLQWQLDDVAQPYTPREVNSSRFNLPREYAYE